MVNSAVAGHIYLQNDQFGHSCNISNVDPTGDTSDTLHTMEIRMEVDSISHQTFRHIDFGVVAEVEEHIVVVAASVAVGSVAVVVAVHSAREEDERRVAVGSVAVVVAAEEEEEKEEA